MSLHSKLSYEDKQYIHDQLFIKASADFLEEHDVESRQALLLNSIEMLEQFGSEDFKVKLFNPTFQSHGWESPYTILQCLTKDRPFVVDSLKLNLRHEAVVLKHMLHPILSVERSESGNFLGFNTNAASFKEAYQISLLEKVEDHRLVSLTETLQGVFQQLVHATDDYHMMRKYVVEAAQQMRETATPASEEASKFLTWLDADNFIFLGYQSRDISLGICKDIQFDFEEYKAVTAASNLIISKNIQEARLHRPARLDQIILASEVQQECFIGLFSSKALSATAEHIPLLNKKLEAVLEQDAAQPSSHDYKEIISHFNSFPKESLFAASVHELHSDIRNIMDSSDELRLRLRLRAHPHSKMVSAMLLLPRERFSAEVRKKLQDHLTKTLQADRVDYQLALGEDESQVRLHFFLQTEKSLDAIDSIRLENDLNALSRSWRELVEQKLLSRKGEVAKPLVKRYLERFDDSYRAMTPIDIALKDIEAFEHLGDNKVHVECLNPLDDRYGGGATHLRIYHQKRSLVLSEVLPSLENLGLRVLEQISYFLKPDGAEPLRGLDIFRVQTLTGEVLELSPSTNLESPSVHQRLTKAVEGLLTNQQGNDPLNRLVLYGGLTMRQIALLQSYRMHYAQLYPEVSRAFITDTLIAYPELSSCIVDAFTHRFDNSLDLDKAERKKAFEADKQALLDGLQKVPSLTADKLLRGMFGLIENTLRTNFFTNKESISLKLASSELEGIPEPKPYREISVWHPEMAGIHLRGGPVARGGLRWSDRPDDFRTEVLGLMKTQMTKNAVIVPVGSKGGFILKKNLADRDAQQANVQVQYRRFIQGMLDITDNIVEGETVHPEGLIIYDAADPYLVVAADKGTAKFSDLANETAAANNFWLGDAFASGGSQGYDHKKEAITARGAWVCVERHFRELDIDIHKETFTVVGIGDMAGDVFGNGMLHSDNLKLLAAFNHMHIFLDPDPDPKTSFQERKRLFELPRSSWQDYSSTLLSEGGGIYSRFEKSITLTPQVQSMLKTTEATMSGQDLIRAILKAPVDLLWNGGIGTYVKATFERNNDIGDSSNDGVRIDTTELNARIIGEGGNLGLSQAARIEYALAGGKINTDAIDNSAGVDMSDHEVNIKILLEDIVKQGQLSPSARNQLLESMTDEVSDLVLKDNLRQSLALSLAERRSKKDLDSFIALQKDLLKTTELNPELEGLPSTKVLLARQEEGQSLVRPELAILLAYSKMKLYQQLLESNLEEASALSHHLMDYFPKVLQQKYPKAIKEHALKQEIIATQFCNKVINLLGIDFVQRMQANTGESAFNVVRAALIAMHLLDSELYLAALRDSSTSSDAKYKSIEIFVNAVDELVPIILTSKKSLPSIIEAYYPRMNYLFENIVAHLSPREKSLYQESHDTAIENGFSPEVATKIASMEYAGSTIVLADLGHSMSPEETNIITGERNAVLTVIANHYYALSERLNFGWLLDNLTGLSPKDKWERIAMSDLQVNLYTAMNNIAKSYLDMPSQDTQTLEGYLAREGELLNRYDSVIAELKEDEGLTLASGYLLASLLKGLS